MNMLQDHKGESFFDHGSPKAMFYMGLLAGVATMSTIGLALVLGMLVSGKAPGTLALAGTGNEQVTPTPTTPTPAPAGEAPSAAAPVKEVDEKNEAIRGKKNAKVTLIEYSDFECPFCLRHKSSIDQALKDYPNDVRVVYRHFPLSFHPQAQKAAEAAECAGKQGKFWEMHDKIFEANEQKAMSVDKWKEVARTLKIDGAKFDKCLDSGATAAKIANDLNEGSAAGVGGTPGTFVNGQLVEGAVPYAAFKQIIEQKLKG